MQERDTDPLQDEKRVGIELMKHIENGMRESVKAMQKSNDCQAGLTQAITTMDEKLSKQLSGVSSQLAEILGKLDKRAD